MSRVILILVVAVWGLIAEAAVYKWTDQQGRVHFSDRPVDVQAEQVHVVPSANSQPPPLEQAERERKRRRLLEVYREERLQKQVKAAEHKRVKAEKQQNCLKAQRRYARFNQAGGIYESDESGERRYLDREKRAAFIAKLQAEVDRWCAE